MGRELVLVVAAAVAISGCARSKPVDPLYERFSKAIFDAGIHVTPPMNEAYQRELDTCRRLREGEYEAFDLATLGVTEQDKQRGQIITVAIPVLCPDQQPALDVALSSTAKQSHFSDGNYVVAMVPKGRGTVQPGTYSVTDAPVSDCFWQRRDAQGNIVEEFVALSHQVTVTILSTDRTFVSEGCGDWKRVG